LSLEIEGEEVGVLVEVDSVLDVVPVVEDSVVSVAVEPGSVGSVVDSVAVEPVSAGGSESRKVIPMAPEANSPAPNRHAKASTYLARRSAL
jgi:hypothetical protein